MAENMSPNLQLDDLSAEDITLSKVQAKPEVPFSLPGSVTDEECPFLTPEPKLASQKRHDYPSYASEIFLSSISGSSDISTKEGSETLSSSSSSDAESGTYDQHVNGDEDLQPKVIDPNVMEEDLHLANEEDGEDMLEETKDLLYEEMLKKVANYENELNFTTNKLQSSQEEIARLKYENLTLVEELGNTIEKLKTSEVNKEKMEHDLRNEFEQHQHQFQHQLDLANQSIDLLQAELGSERSLIAELQEMINKTTNDLNDYGREVEELKCALHDAQKDFSKDRSQFQYDITCLNEQKDALELRNKALEEQINQYEIEKIEAGKLQEEKEIGLLDEIKQLNMELSQQSHAVETLNKNLDANNLKYDTLMAERDEVLAKVQKLVAELNARDINVLQMEERISKLSADHMELLNESVKTKKQVEELRSKVIDQEKEVQKQRDVIHDCANEKREAIRQLCFSLEYYRNEYHELRQVFIKCKQPAAVLAM